MRDPRVIVQKFGSVVCTAKSADGPNPYFTHDIYTRKMQELGQVNLPIC